MTETEEISSEKKEENQVWPPKPQFAENAPNITGSLISLILFVGLFLVMGMELRMVFMILLVLLIHEMGHFVSMKQFGYKNVNMFFVPMFGAYVSGENDEASEAETLITVMAGPVPGILLGLIFLYLEKSLNLPQLKMLPEIFLSLNLLNLLPLIPLDGGRIIEALFTGGKGLLENIFLGISLLMVFALSWWLQSLPALLIALFIILRFRTNYKNDQLRRLLIKNGLDPKISYSKLSDENFWKMEGILRQKLGGVEIPLQVTATWVKNLLLPQPSRRLNPWIKVLVLIFWLACLIIPVLLYFGIHMEEIRNLTEPAGISA